MSRSQPFGLLDKPDGDCGGNIMHRVPPCSVQKAGGPQLPMPEPPA